MTNGFEAMWSLSDITKKINGFIDKKEKQIFMTLSYVGEQFINEARNIDTYTDRTGNLRNSIGYIVAKDGKIKDSDFRGGDGGEKAREVANDVLSEFKQGWVLIGMAGMEYAAAVEAKEYDVISGSAIHADKILKDLIKNLK